MSAMRTFFIGVGKVALAIVLAVVLLSLLGWGVYAYYQHREAEKNAPLATPKGWPAISVPALDNARFSLRTIWKDRRVSYQFRMTGYPKQVATTRDQHGPRSREDGTFTLTFLDQAGFKLFDHKVLLREMALNVDDKGQGGGLEIRGDFYTDADEYRSAASWELTWAF